MKKRDQIYGGGSNLPSHFRMAEFDYANVAAMFDIEIPVDFYKTNTHHILVRHPDDAIIPNGFVHTAPILTSYGAARHPAYSMLAWHEPNMIKLMCRYYHGLVNQIDNFNFYRHTDFLQIGTIAYQKLIKIGKLSMGELHFSAIIVLIKTGIIEPMFARYNETLLAMKKSHRADFSVAKNSLEIHGVKFISFRTPDAAVLYRMMYPSDVLEVDGKYTAGQI